MKKMFFASALAVGLLAACSNEDVVTSVPDGGTAEAGLVPVELAMKAPVSIVTRGMGTVGGLVSDAENNIWRGETLYFNMYMKKTALGRDTLGTSYWVNVDEMGTEVPVYNFNNEPIAISSDELAEDPTVAVVKGTGAKYYPQDGTRHDFFAYRIDDSAVETDDLGRPVIHDEVDAEGVRILQKSVKFVIDGSQDLMVGQADPDLTEDAYSAKSARAGVVPQIKMEHLLTRFTFEVVAGDKTADGLQVQKVSVVSKNTGRMIMAWNPNQAPDMDGKIIWDADAEPVDLVLKQRPALEGGEPVYLQPLEDMAPVNLGWNPEPDAVQEVVPVGEALMVAPMESEYLVHITTKQQIEDGTTNTYVSEGKIKITADGQPSVARPGTSYKVTVKLYGLSKIELTTKLTGWASGEDINVDTATD